MLLGLLPDALHFVILVICKVVLLAAGHYLEHELPSDGRQQSTCVMLKVV
jgi:hypothetical protein